MKVACIGNMNNNFFNLVRYLRDNHIDAELLLFNNDFDHFHPSADSYNDEYKLYTKQLSWGDRRSFIMLSRKKIVEDLKGYDFIIGCGLAPAFLRKAGRSLDIFVPYGADIYDIPFFKITNFKRLIVSIFVSRAQRLGIVNSRFINSFSTNPELEDLFLSLKIKAKRLYSGVPMVYLPQYTDSNIKKYSSEYSSRFNLIRKNNDFVVFHQSRLIWKNIPNPLSYKGNDKIIKGFADFVKANKSIKSCLILFEYGSDVAETKKLIQDLNIENHIQWFPKLSRKDIMSGLYCADICVGELGMSWLTYGVVYEALTMSKPFMGYREDHLYTDFYKELYPMINVFSETDVANSFFDYINNKVKYEAIGSEGHKWLKTYAIDNSIKEYIRIISEK